MSRGHRIDGVNYAAPAEADAFCASGAWLWSTLGDELRGAAAAAPAKPYIIGDRLTLTFDQVDAQSESIAASLREVGLHPGDRAIFQVGSIPELVPALFGCLKAGVIPVCTLPQYREIEIGQLARQSAARAYFVQADVSGTFDQLAFARRMAAEHPALSVIVVLRGEVASGEHALDALSRRYSREQARERLRPYVPHPEDVSFFQLSGGSTGVPKIIPRIHAEYLGDAVAWNARHRLTSDDICLWSLPLIYNAGMLVMLVPCLLGRRSLVLQPRFEVQAFLKAIEQYRVTYTGSIGPIAPRIIDCENVGDFDLSSLRMLFTLARADALEKRVGIPSQTIFGITEGLLMASAPDAEIAARHGTMGHPTGAHEVVKVIDAAGNDVADGVTGELCFKGPHTLRGYYDAPEATAAAFTPDGFFRSGDLVRATTIGGIRHFAFEGRIKDNINRGGEKFGAAEVETLVARHPAVLDVHVVAMPCPIYGERACAFLVLRAGHAAPTVQELSAFLQSLGLAKYKSPEHIELIDAVPVTRVGKVDKAALRARIADLVAAEAAGGKSRVA